MIHHRNHRTLRRGTLNGQKLGPGTIVVRSWPMSVHPIMAVMRG
jgi:hypothetical protein